MSEERVSIPGITDEDLIQAKYYVRSMRPTDGSDFETWVISPICRESGNDIEVFDIKVKKGSEVAKKLRTLEARIVDMVFDKDPELYDNVSLINLDKPRDYRVGLGVSRLKKKGYDKFKDADEVTADGKVAIIPFSEELERVVHDNGHAAVMAAQFDIIRKLKEEQNRAKAWEERREKIRLKDKEDIGPLVIPETTELMNSVYKTIEAGISSEIYNVEDSIGMYKEEITDTLISNNRPEGWNDENIYFSRFTSNDVLIKNVIPELLRKIDNTHPENRKNLINIIETHLDKDSIDAEEFLDKFSKLSKSDRADIPLLLMDKETSSKAYNLDILSDKLDEIWKADASGEILANTIKIVNMTEDGGSQLILELKEEIKMQTGEDGFDIRETTRAKLDDFFGVGGWDDTFLKSVHMTNSDIYNALLSVDNDTRLQIVDEVEQLSALETARDNLYYTKEAYEGGNLEVPYEIEDFLGRKGKVYNMNYNNYIDQPDSSDIIRRLDNEGKGQVAQNIIDMYAQRALHTKITSDTHLTFARQQINLVSKGILAEPNPHEFKQVENNLKGPLKKSKTMYEPTEEMLDLSFEVSQAAGAQVMAQLSKLTYDLVPEGQFIRSKLTEKIKPFTEKGNLENNVGFIHYLIDRDANHIDRNAKPGEPTNTLTTVKHMNSRDFGPVDNRFIKGGLSEAFKTNAKLFTMIMGGSIIGGLEGLDNSL